MLLVTAGVAESAGSDPAYQPKQQRYAKMTLKIVESKKESKEFLLADDVDNHIDYVSEHRCETVVKQRISLFNGGGIGAPTSNGMTRLEFPGYKGISILFHLPLVPCGRACGIQHVDCN